MTELLPKGSYYKINLHCHTILSDGRKTAEEVKQDYLAHGYSAVAFTDHDKYVPHNELTDSSFVALNGFELEYYKDPWKGQTCHLCFVSKTPDNSALGYSDPEGEVFLYKLRPGDPDPAEGGGLYTVPCPGRKYTPDYINADIRRGRELGFFVTYNHPTWSLEHWREYLHYEGPDAMEIANYDCLVGGYGDNNGRVYEDMLALSPDLRCIATDDNHNEVPDSSPYTDSYGGYVMVAARELSYAGIMEALDTRRFYSCARVNPVMEDCPHFLSLTISEGVLRVETEPCTEISLIRDQRPFGICLAKPRGTVTEAEFKLEACQWFRLELTGSDGNKAYTCAYPGGMA